MSSFEILSFYYSSLLKCLVTLPQFLLLYEVSWLGPDTTNSCKEYYQWENDELLHRNIIKELNVLTDGIILSTGVVAIELLDIILG